MKRLFLCCLFVLLVSVSISGCKVGVSPVKNETAKDMVSNLKYAKDLRTGLCFAMIASEKPGDSAQSGIGVTWVPCEAVRSVLVN